jgi:hypothetical protein
MKKQQITNQDSIASRRELLKSLSAAGVVLGLSWLGNDEASAKLLTGRELLPGEADLPIKGIDQDRIGETVRYGDNIGLALPHHRHHLLSGGSSVRSEISVVDLDETWQFRSESGKSGVVRYNQRIHLALSKNDLLLSGSPKSGKTGGVRSETTNADKDETWQVQNLSVGALMAGKPIKYGALVTLSLPFHGGLLLSGGGSVRVGTTTASLDETWIIVPVS